MHSLLWKGNASKLPGRLEFLDSLPEQTQNESLWFSSFPIYWYKGFHTFPLLKCIMKATRLNSSIIGQYFSRLGTRIFLWMFPLCKAVAREKVTDPTGMAEALGPLDPITWGLQTKITRSPSVLDPTSAVAQIKSVALSLCTLIGDTACGPQTDTHSFLPQHQRQPDYSDTVHCSSPTWHRNFQLLLKLIKMSSTLSCMPELSSEFLLSCCLSIASSISPKYILPYCITSHYLDIFYSWWN